VEKQMKRPCGNCGAQSVKKIKLKDTWFNEPWKDFPRVYVSNEVIQYRCEKCGEFAGTKDSAKAFDAAVRESIQVQVSYFVARIKEKTKLSLTEIAARIPMGYQHISDLKNHRSFPSYHYWSLLHSIYKNPDLLDQLDPRSDKPPLSRIG
jgi:hypothetical protein